ncbi:DUF3618 domain-containing protein [Polymorphobacter megasporae]|uniref:DUF3618 domain-containing protein n=1 Tax=Glacieibacterium megasporae TaxID=2835787 RepID=UPI001C1DEBFA|nr:DUF3618 domain-containing protein [Polymorphobacter megasporae]UAJ10592.1 DUF3618 domain-containing protein [Polymorphobacter megasporae]
MTSETKAIETEAAVTRDRIAGTIDELQARLSPQALVDNAIGSISLARKKAVTSAQTAAGGHPVALGAAGLAIGIALLARSRSTRTVSEHVDSFTVGADNNKSLTAHRADGHSQAGAASKHIDAIHSNAHTAHGDASLAILVVSAATGALLGTVIPVGGVEMSVLDEVRARLSAAGDIAIASAKDELDVSKLSLSGGVDGITKRITASLVKIMHEASAALGRPVKTRLGK